MTGEISDAASASGDPAGQRTLNRVLDILNLLSEEQPDWSSREVVDATGLPKSTVIRLLQTLERTGVLWVNEDRRYVAGPSLLRWTALAASAWQVSANGREAVRQAATLCGETAHLYVRRGLRRVCIATQQGRQALRQIVRVGDELPLWTGGAADVLLIGASPERMRRLTAMTPSHADGVDALLRSVAQVAELGYGVSHDDPEPGLSMVAVPIQATGGHVLASLSIGGPSARITADRAQDYAKTLSALAAELSEADFAQIPKSSFPGREGKGRSWSDPV